MAYLEQLKLTGTLKVQTGTTDTGSPKLSSVSMGKFKADLNPTSNANKLYALYDAIAACILNMVHRGEIGVTSQLLPDD